VTAGNLGAALRRLHTLLRPRSAERTDRDLLGRFVADRDGAAFEALVRRHGPMVLGVCRRVLGNAADADDAFQATFLVLVRKAASLANPDLVAPWLHAVAVRTAAEARARAAKRRRRESEVPPVAVTDTPSGEGADLRPLLDEELAHVPEKYRAPLVLCYLEGKTHHEAARALGVRPGSMSWRLARGRELLRRRLVKRGIVLSAVAVAGALTADTAPAALPASLLDATVRAGLLFAAGGPGTTPAVTLAEGVLRAMTASRFRVATAVLVAVLILGTGAAFLVPAGAAPRPRGGDGPVPAAKAEPLTDRNGDPLPAGAVARLGTVRFRTAHALTSLVFAADGKTLTATGWGETVQVWDAATGRELHRLAMPLDTKGPRVLAPDGRTLALGSIGPDLRVRLVDVTTGKDVRSLDAGGFVGALRFTPDGKTLAWVSGKEVGTWDLGTGKEVRRGPAPADGLGVLAVAPGGKALALAGRDPVVHVWDAGAGRPLFSLEGQRDRVCSAAFSPDGKTLATAADLDEAVRLWDAATGKAVRRLPGPGGWARALAWSPDGKTLATGGQDGRIRLWDPPTGEERQQFLLPGQDDDDRSWVTALAFSPDGKVLASAGTEHVVRSWDVAAGKEMPSPEGHLDGVTSAAYSPDGKLVATAGADKTVRLWDAAAGKTVRVLGGEGGGLSSVRFSPDGKLVAAAGPGGAATLWETATGKEVFRLEGHAETVSGLAFSPDGKLLATAGGRGHGTVRLWDVAAGKELRKLAEEKQEFHAPAFSPDGKTVAVGLGYEALLLLDVATGQEVHRFRWEKGFAGSVAFSPDGKLLASTGGLGNAVHVWDVGGWAEQRKLTGHAGVVNAVAFAPDGRSLATAGQDNTVILWETATGREVTRFVGHAGQGQLGGVRGLAFAPDGQTVVSGGDDTTALVWDVTGLMRDGRLPALRLRAEALAGSWDDLAGEDAAKAHRAAWTLVAADAVPLLRERLRPVAPAPAARTARLLADLDSDAFEVRDKARRELAELGEAAASALREELAGKPTPEVRRQVEGLLAKLTGDTPERLREARAVGVLEHLATPEAREVLEALAKGVPDSRLTKDAKAALGRLGKPR
jgi:RNA polymerase sigma factor (sigma-70 family)